MRKQRERERGGRKKKQLEDVYVVKCVNIKKELSTKFCNMVYEWSFGFWKCSDYGDIFNSMPKFQMHKTKQTNKKKNHFPKFPFGIEWYRVEVDAFLFGYGTSHFYFGG